MTRVSSTLAASQSKRGQEFEDELETVHEYYKLNSIAVITKMPIKTIVNTNDEGDVYAQVIGKGLSDYLGVIRGGLAIAMEAKETHQKDFTIRIYQKTHNTVHDHQLDFLDYYQAMGAVAIWMVKYAKFNTSFAVQHEQMRKWVPKGFAVNRRISIEEMRSLSSDVCIEVPSAWNGYNYLPAIKMWLTSDRKPKSVVKRGS